MFRRLLASLAGLSDSKLSYDGQNGDYAFSLMLGDHHSYDTLDIIFTRTWFVQVYAYTNVSYISSKLSGHSDRGD